MANAKKLPSGNWRVQASIIIDGKLIRKSFTDSDKRKAERAAAEWQDEKNFFDNKHQMTLACAIDDYINSRKNKRSPSTIATYEKIKRNYFKNLMDMPLCKIDKYKLNYEINLMSQKLAPKTVRSAASFINSVIAYYTEKRLTIDLPQKQKIIYKTPDKTALKAIFKAIENTDIEIAVLLAAWLGLRQSEVRGLKWNKVYSDRIVIDTALVTVNGKSIEKGTKTTDSTRVVALPQYIKNKLDKLERTSEYVVPLTVSVLNKKFKKMLKENNIPDCRFHDLRHSTASIMLLLGIPEKYAMEYCGWETPDVMREVYQQIFDDEKKKVAQKMDSYFMSNIV